MNKVTSSRPEAEVWNEPQQERSKKTLENLINAARSLLKNKPVEEITVSEIAETANCATGSISRRFGSKENLFDAVFDQIIEDILGYFAWIDANIDFSAHTPASLADIFIGNIMRFIHGNQGAIRTAVQRALNHPETLDKLLNVRANMLNTFKNGFLQTKHTIAGHDPGKHVEFALLMVIAMLTSYAAITGDMGSFEEADMVVELKKAFLNYLNESV